MEINEALEYAVRRLKAISYTNPYNESKTILEELLKVNRAYLIGHGDQEIHKDTFEKLESIVDRRLRGEPLQYILGFADFYDDRFYVNPSVLIPRFDTETSVEIIKKYLKDKKTFLEIGVGSGAVILSLAKMYREKTFIGVDISENAIEVANKNKELLKITNVDIFKSDLFSNVKGKFDIIYSNPPYIKTSEILNLQKEVKDYEPKLALDGGKDGLEFYKKIIKDYKNFINPKGLLIFEIGYDQGEDIKKLAEAKIFKDLSGKDRVAVIEVS